MENTASNPTKPDFGNGYYSAVMSEFYGDAKRLLGLNSKQAERAARALGSDLGRRQALAKSINIGKVGGKDKMITVKAVNESIKTNLTYSIGLCKSCALLQESRSYGIKTAVVELTQDCQEWLDEKPLEFVANGPTLAEPKKPVLEAK